MKKALYPHARWLSSLISFFNPYHFAADIDLIREVGKLTRVRDFTYEVQAFVHHPANGGILRRTFNFRISTKQLRRMVRATLHVDQVAVSGDETAVPFPKLSAKSEGGVDASRPLAV